MHRLAALAAGTGRARRASAPIPLSGRSPRTRSVARPVARPIASWRAWLRCASRGASTWVQTRTSGTPTSTTTATSGSIVASTIAADRPARSARPSSASAGARPSRPRRRRRWRPTSTSPGSRSVRAPRGASTCADDLGAQPVALLLLGAEADPRAEPVGQAQHGEVHAQHGAPQQQPLDVAGGDRAVDDDADQDRYAGLADLPQRDQRDRAGEARGAGGRGCGGSAGPRSLGGGSVVTRTSMCGHARFTRTGWARAGVRTATVAAWVDPLRRNPAGDACAGVTSGAPSSAWSARPSAW